MRRFGLTIMALVAAVLPGLAAEPPAKELFGVKASPAPLDPASYGSYAKGCLAGGEALTWNSPNHQVMRLSRNRYWGHPALVDYVERLGAAARQEGWPGLLVGDMAQPRGGPMVSGHSSHQIGLDADIWLQPMPDHLMNNDERENVSAVSMLNADLTEIDRAVWTEQHAQLIRRAALFDEVARIFVHPVIKRELCAWAGEDRGWLRKVRPWYGHHYHFHIRLSCPDGARSCANQPEPPAGDGCGEELQSWFKPPPPEPTKPARPTRPKPELTLADLPAECRAVLEAE